MRLINMLRGPVLDEVPLYRLVLLDASGREVSKRVFRVYDDPAAVEMQVSMKARELARDAIANEAGRKI